MTFLRLIVSYLPLTKDYRSHFLTAEIDPNRQFLICINLRWRCLKQCWKYLKTISPPVPSHPKNNLASNSKLPRFIEFCRFLTRNPLYYWDQAHYSDTFSHLTNPCFHLFDQFNRFFPPLEPNSITRPRKYRFQERVATNTLGDIAILS